MGAGWAICKCLHPTPPHPVLQMGGVGPRGGHTCSRAGVLLHFSPEMPGSPVGCGSQPRPVQASTQPGPACLPPEPPLQATCPFPLLTVLRSLSAD